MAEAAAAGDKVFCMSEVDIFCDLDASEMDRFADAAPMRMYAAGSLIHTPHEAVETLFILKKGRIRIFRVSADGRVLTTAILEPGTIFGEMVVIGQQMHDNFAEAMEDAVTCEMNKADVQQMLLGDRRIAARISETLGRRLAQLEQRLTDTTFKTVPERIASTLLTLTDGRAASPLAKGIVLKLTHEQLAALTGTTRETATKVLGELAASGAINLGRGRITITDAHRLADLAGI